MGLNKGESHRALKQALNFNRRDEITDRTSENQHLRMMHLNLLAAITIQEIDMNKVVMITVVFLPILSPIHPNNRAPKGRRTKVGQKAKAESKAVV